MIDGGLISYPTSRNDISVFAENFTAAFNP